MELRGRGLVFFTSNQTEVGNYDADTTWRDGCGSGGRAGHLIVCWTQAVIMIHPTLKARTSVSVIIGIMHRLIAQNPQSNLIETTS